MSDRALTARIFAAALAGAVALALLGIAGCAESISDANELEARIESFYDETGLAAEARCGYVNSDFFAGGLQGIDAYEATWDYYACAIDDDRGERDFDAVVRVDGADWNVALMRTCSTCRWRSPESILSEVGQSD